MDQGLTEEHIRNLPNAQQSNLFTDAEKAAINYGQKLARDHKSITDEDFAGLYRHFSERQVMAICMLAAQFVGVGRMLATLDTWNPVCEIRCCS